MGKARHSFLSLCALLGLRCSEAQRLGRCMMGVVRHLDSDLNHLSSPVTTAFQELRGRSRLSKRAAVAFCVGRTCVLLGSVGLMRRFDGSLVICYPKTAWAMQAAAELVLVLVWPGLTWILLAGCAALMNPWRRITLHMRKQCTLLPH